MDHEQHPTTETPATFDAITNVAEELHNLVVGASYKRQKELEGKKTLEILEGVGESELFPAHIKDKSRALLNAHQTAAEVDDNLDKAAASIRGKLYHQHRFYEPQAKMARLVASQFVGAANTPSLPNRGMLHNIIIKIANSGSHDDYGADISTRESDTGASWAINVYEHPTENQSWRSADASKVKSIATSLASVGISSEIANTTIIIPDSQLNSLRQQLQQRIAAGEDATTAAVKMFTEPLNERINNDQTTVELLRGAKILAREANKSNKNWGKHVNQLESKLVEGTGPSK